MAWNGFGNSPCILHLPAHEFRVCVGSSQGIKIFYFSTMYLHVSAVFFKPETWHVCLAEHGLEQGDIPRRPSLTDTWAWSHYNLAFLFLTVKRRTAGLLEWVPHGRD